MATRFTKRAEDSNFETKLHQLVYPEVAAKAPRLMSNLIAFELLDVNNDDTEATGIYAFRVGKQLVYLPVVYTDGAISPLDELYMASEDLFIPLTEEWIDYLFSRQPYELGQLAKKKDMQPDGGGVFQSLQDVFNKRGSAFMQTVTADLSLEKMLPKFGKRAKAAMWTLLDAMRKNDDFGRAMLKYYPVEKLAAIRDRLETPPEKQIGLTDSKKKPEVFMTGDVAAMGLGLGKKDIDELRRTGVVVKDNRDPKEVTKAFRTSIPTTWGQPGDPGIYNIAMADGSVSECTVSRSLVPVGEGKIRAALVFSSDGFAVVPAGKLVTTSEASVDGWDKVFKDADKITSTTPDRDELFVIIDDKGNSTLPLRFIGKSSSPDNYDEWYVEQNSDSGMTCCARQYRTDGLVVSDYVEVNMDSDSTITPFVRQGREKNKPLETWDYERGRRVVIVPDSNDTEMTAGGNTLLVTDGCRIVRLKKDPLDPIKPDALTWWTAVKTASAYSKMTVINSSGEYDISCGLVKFAHASRPQAIKHLVAVHGLCKEAALEVLKDVDAALAKGTGKIKLAIKYASDYPAMGSSGIQGEPLALNASEDNSIDTASKVNMDPYVGEPMLEKDVQNAAAAANSGKKSIFDTAVLMGLLRKHDIASAIHEMLGDLVIGLDRIGRILFLIHTHKDKFEDEYGSDNVSKLVDSISTLFTEFGEMVLFFKRRGANAGKGDESAIGLVQN